MRTIRKTAVVAGAAGALIVTGALSASAITAPKALDPGVRVVGLTSTNGITSINTGTDKASTTKSIKGLNGNEKVVGIDYRPATNKLYGLVLRTNDTLRVVKISPATGNTYSSKTLVDAAGAAIKSTGSSFGVDFNPTVDRLRVVNEKADNYRINVDTGATTVDGKLAFAAGDANAGKTPRVPSVAYTNSRGGPSATGTTVLYDIEAGTDALLRQAPPNDGTLNTVAKLGKDVRGSTGFDIANVGGTDIALISNTSKGQTKLYKINLANGATLQKSEIKNKTIIGLAAPTGR
ncbi:DUF4394 domain-containing protein [Solicola sp. PLA-1-18]|uniref:DUF4394 domain-containing protein n=1 Tax=Solicola sp. PLA-1-18 TaxID=3380532 RepID=UPI003B81D46D